MNKIFSPKFRYTTWRRLWIALARAEQSLGLPITDNQIKAMESAINKIDLEAVHIHEKALKHDVMAHIYAYEDLCPEAKGIIHLGATSAFVTDNADLIQMKEGLKLLKIKLVESLRLLAKLAETNASLATTSFTHLQPAQPTTVGKRICLWLQDFLFDFHDLLHLESSLYFLGIKGATGTQASFMELFDQDAIKVEKLDNLIAKEMDFEKLLVISGQTYTRKQDVRLFSFLQSFASTTHKFATDLRLLAHLGEMQEPFGEKQVGSSAMPHKRNPILSERICGLSRFLIALGENPVYTHATQWLERSLDDSANRRLTIPEGFLCADSILNLCIHLFSHLSINKEIIETNLKEHLPYLSLESILMLAASKGKDRQEVHEKLRLYSQKPDFLKCIEEDGALGFSKEEIKRCLKTNIGRAETQVKTFLNEEVFPFLKKYQDLKIQDTRVEI